MRVPFHYDDSPPRAPLTVAPTSLADISIPVARVQAGGDAKVRATLQALGDPVRGVPVGIVAAWRALTDDQRLALIEQGCRFCGGLERRCWCQGRED